MRYVTVNGDRRIPCEAGDNLYQVLTSAGYVFPGNCGGRGICERCRVTIKETGSFVKSCQSVVDADISVSLSQAQEMEDITVSQPVSYEHESKSLRTFAGGNESFGVAIDVGTTTVACELVNLTTDEILASASCINSQMEAGADVVSRIQAAGTREGMLHLRSLIFDDISRCISRMQKDVPAASDRITRYVISGNAVMLSIVEGYTTENLYGAPFLLKNGEAYLLKASDTSFVPMTEPELSEKKKGIQILCLPNLAAFIGADVLGGACAAGLYQRNGCRMLIDLGTNGEIILYKDTHGMAASAACGSAFEGCFRQTTVYGSSVFDRLAALRQLGRIDAYGGLSVEHPEQGIRMGGGFTIDQDMIRSFQLGKSAIASAISMLMRAMHVRAEEIETVYLSGGLGFHLHVEHAVSLGLFPAEFAKKIKILGNTSLQGAYLALMDANFIDTINRFKETLTNLSLSELSDFQECFLNHLSLEPFCADEEIQNIKDT